MTNRGRIRTALGAALLAVVAAGLVAGPASAAPVTRWVDDDGKAGPTSCDGNGAAKVSLVVALGFASPEDTIKVCPGTYPGPITVSTPGVRIVSVKPHKAVIRPQILSAVGAPAGDGSLIKIAADNVTLQGLRINLGVTDVCWSYTGIGVQAVTGVVLRGNRIDGRSDTSSFTCGLADGIAAQLTDRSQRLTIAGNTIRNHRNTGILLQGGSLVVSGNTIIWAHGPQIAGSASVSRGAHPAVSGPRNPAISVSGAKATIRDNRVTTTRSAASAPEGGIELFDSRVSVRGNRVTGSDYALTGTGSLRGRITGNIFRNGENVGILLYTIGVPPTAALNVAVEVDHNQVHGFVAAGIALQGASTIGIHHNDFRNNPGTDCVDQTVPTPNAWAWGTPGHNLGNDQNQPKLCKRS